MCDTMEFHIQTYLRNTHYPENFWETERTHPMPNVIRVPLSREDAEYYVANASVPALPRVKDTLINVLRWDASDAVALNLYTSTAVEFLKESDRPLELPSGKSLADYIDAALFNAGLTEDGAPLDGASYGVDIPGVLVDDEEQDDEEPTLPVVFQVPLGAAQFLDANGYDENFGGILSFVATPDSVVAAVREALAEGGYKLAKTLDEREEDRATRAKYATVKGSLAQRKIGALAAIGDLDNLQRYLQGEDVDVELND